MSHPLQILPLLLALIACNDPVPDPAPPPDPITPPTEPDPEPCQINTRDHGCITRDRFDDLKTDLLQVTTSIRATTATSTARPRNWPKPGPTCA